MPGWVMILRKRRVGGACFQAVDGFQLFKRTAYLFGYVHMGDEIFPTRAITVLVVGQAGDLAHQQVYIAVLFLQGRLCQLGHIAFAAERARRVDGSRDFEGGQGVPPLEIPDKKRVPARAHVIFYHITNCTTQNTA